MTQDRQIVITGGSGRLGRYVTERLAVHNRVLVVDKTDPAIAGVAFRNADVLDLDAMTEVMNGADGLIHLAAVPNPRTASPEICFRVNTIGTWTALTAARAAGVTRAVVASSDSATGLHFNPEGWPPQYLPVDEHHPLRPTEVYSLTKEITESVCRCFAAAGGIEIKVIRPAHIVFEPEFPELRDRGEDVMNYHLWNFVAPEDVARGFELALHCPDGSYDCIFIGAEDGLNSRPTLEMFRERFGTDPIVRDPALYATRPNAGIFGITHAREALGYVPEYDRETLFRKAKLQP